MQNFATKADYEAVFGPVRAEALRTAHDIRKFEIELYWKRATYFWTIIGVAFAGFFALGKDGPTDNQVIVACVGFVFSLGWYMVNRSSSAWQRNWEIHVDLLEDSITGPLYKTYMSRSRYRIWRLWSPYAFSPTKVNAILSSFVVAAWLGLLVSRLMPPEWVVVPPNLVNGAFAVLGAVILLIWGKSDMSSHNETFVSTSRWYP
jgi:hypothetical protein